MNAPEKRRINTALDQLEAGDIRSGYDALCRLVRREPGAGLFPRTMTPVERPTGLGVRPPPGSLPVSGGRIEDTQAIKQYREAHPVCEVEAQPPELYDCEYVEHGHVEVHHLIRRSQQGSDEESNLLSLCAFHHTGGHGFHSVGPVTWYARLHERLSVEARNKVRTALKL